MSDRNGYVLHAVIMASAFAEVYSCMFMLLDDGSISARKSSSARFFVNSSSP